MNSSPDLSLSRDQESLLRTALASNPRGSPRAALDNMNPQTIAAGNSMANGSNTITSPTKSDTPGSGKMGDLNESPFLDYELEDGNFDWDDSQENLFGDLPESGPLEGEQHDKRKASTDNEATEEGTSKRREGEEKQAKKPGRKPLTAEPTTKRKAQNRAAQRAFRERKERHLKDLETKVDDLEKASEATNHENGRLRAQVDKLNTELREYRKRVSLMSNGSNPSPPPSATATRSYSNSNDFQFAFPKFGDLPSTFINNGSIAKPSARAPSNNAVSTSPGPSNVVGDTATSPTILNPVSTDSLYASPTSTNQNAESTFNNNLMLGATDFKDLTDLFSPSILETVSRSNSADYVGGQSNATSVRKDSSSIANGSSSVPKAQRTSSASNTTSPISSMSQNGLDSSCGTTPESSPESPDNRKSAEPTLNTINEETTNQSKTEAPVGVVRSPGADINGIDWLAQQNGGQFDPVLFGDYRDPQDNILNNTYGDFFNEAFHSPQDFNSPYNTGETTEGPQQPKHDLMKEIELQQNGGPEDAVSGQSSETISYDKLWGRLESSKKYTSGGNNLDELCSQLKAKARCSETGAIIESKDVDKILGPSEKDSNDFLKMFS